MSELLKNYGTYVEWLIPNKAKFKANQTKERNQCTHITQGIKEKENYEELYLHASAVRLLCYGISFVMLGLKENDIIEALENSRFANVIRWVKEFYSK